MGNNPSPARPPPDILQSRDIPGLAKYIESDKCKNVFLMVGAGVSTSAGIPDFRSPNTGLYSNLARLNLPHPEAVFEINYFRHNPIPFYTLAKELYPGRFRPTIAHSFIHLLSTKSLLHTCYTQNIDTLERRAGVPKEKIIEAHGSFATQRCIECKAPYDDEKMKRKVTTGKVPLCEMCGGLVKPDIVFFGESLPPHFAHSVGALGTADLLIVMGTSLTVHPFASLVHLVPDECPRVLINLDLVGDFGSRPHDVVCLGDCDETVRKLCTELGWSDELTSLWEATADSSESADEQRDAPKKVEDEVEELTQRVGKSLALERVTEKISTKQQALPSELDTAPARGEPQADSPSQSSAPQLQSETSEVRVDEPLPDTKPEGKL